MDNALDFYEAALLAEFIGTNRDKFLVMAGKFGEPNPATVLDNLINKLADIADEGNK